MLSVASNVKSQLGRPPIKRLETEHIKTIYDAEFERIRNDIMDVDD